MTERNKQNNPSSASSFWQHKPWWCQPWTILLTGSSLIGLLVLAYQLYNAPWWLVSPPFIGILGWWFLFLVIVPNSSVKE
ncbi:MAG: DUF6737 family protein [Cyanobium sp.]